jgi:hypothetical protein
MAVSSASVLTRDFEKLPTVGDYTHPNRGMGSSDLVEPDFGSLTGGIHHMRDPLVSDSKSGKVRVHKVRGSGSPNRIRTNAAS